MDTNESSLCRPGGFALTRQMFQFAGIEIPEAGAAETESTEPAVSLRVIDIGCGTGGTMRWLSEHFPDWQISGLDKNPDVHEPGWIETGCAEKLPYPDQTADIILMECSCSKAAEPAAALREVYRVLKPEGWLLMSDMYARKKELFLDGMLGRLESAKTIRDRLAEAGFVLAKMQDASGTLAEWIGQQIFDGNLKSVCAALGAERKILKEAACGYFIAAAQPSGLWRTLSYVKEKSPFYQKKFTSVWGQLGEMAGSDVRLAPDSFSWADFRTLPLTTPEELKAEPETFLCVPAKEIARIITLKTSGSTGAPKRLFFTEDDLMQTADFFETGMQYMVKPGDRVTVYMEGPGFFSIGGLLKEGLGRIQVETKVHGLIHDMEAAARDGEGADCLIGVPSQMYALAAHAPGLRPKTVLLSADYVPVSVQRFLEKTWNCRVFTHWGMTETGYGGGVQCGARAGYHLRDRDLLIEILDPETGQPVPEGQYGELVLTTLRRRGMPLVRYRTGDLGRMIAEPCACGCLKPRLDKVEGRLDDSVRLSGGKVLSMHILDELLFALDEVEDFQASYNAAQKHLTVAVMKKAGYADAVGSRVKNVKAALTEYFGNCLTVAVIEKEISPYIGSGKRRLIIEEK